MKTVAVVLAAFSIMLLNEQVNGQDYNANSSAAFSSIRSIEGFYDTGRFSFSITFMDPQPIEHGYEFQLFFDADFSSSTGYGLGYEALLRGVQLTQHSPLDFVNTIGTSSSGGWGRLLGSASFDQISPFDFHISIPRIQPLPLTGAVSFGIEIYQWGVLVDSASGLDTSRAPFEDCNGNGLADSQEVTDGLTPDCNANGIPDSCDLYRNQTIDCNRNGVPDMCDIATFSSTDCSGNLIPDECEEDCNHNNQADSCDLAMGLSHDCDLNEIPDECQPLAEGRGPRHLEIHPPAGLEPVAIRIRGTQNDSVVSCVDGYVQADGSLGATPLFQVPDVWCTVFVSNFGIVADKEYTVDILNANNVQVSTSARTWLWGDLNHDLEVSIVDVVYSISSSQHVIVNGFPTADIVPCDPDGEIDIGDIISVINALVGINPDGLLCGPPCG